MSPTLNNGDIVKIRSYVDGRPTRGDIIVFAAPTSPERDFIKRIIGMPGDIVEITADGKVIVGGAVLDEPYAAGRTVCGVGECKWVIPKGGGPESQQSCGSDACYFVMGDNRQNSSDSRQGWLVRQQNIYGFVRPE